MTLPTYEYRCPECGHEKEVRKKITDDPTEFCGNPFAGGCLDDPCDVMMVRLISKTSFSLKGPGWAKDGYK